MKILRLITTYDCPRNCEGCCNKQRQFSGGAVPFFDDDYKKYDQIILTGGEPMLYITSLILLINFIRLSTKAKIILYTAKLDDPRQLIIMLHGVDGMTVTLHEKKDVNDFRKMNNLLIRSKSRERKSLRLNVFSEVNIKHLNTSLWDVKDGIEWIDDCPLPNGEEIYKLQPREFILKG